MDFDMSLLASQIPSLYITTPIYYINDRPHIGHLYTSTMADIIARYYRMSGASVFLSTGTDEHGSKVAQAALKSDQTPQAYVDQMVGHFHTLVDKANIQYDDFVRTTQERHHACATALWEKLVASGSVYQGHYSGWYAVRDEAYYDETELVKNPQGDVCAPTGAPVEWVQEDCFFFKLSAWQQPLLDFYRRNPHTIGPDHRYNEVIAFIERGLHDFAISRTHMSWGIPVPKAPGHVMYVWVDALANYLTVLGYPNESSSLFQRFWPCCVHLLGKDIVRFHAIYWPALLMAAGLELPQRIFAHGWWMNEGQKMSKSLGNVIDPHHLLDTYGVDTVRYFLARHVRFGHDGDFQTRLLEQTYDSELVHGIGNLAHRVLTFVHSQWKGNVPQWYPDMEDEACRQVINWGSTHKERLHTCMAQQDIFGYIECLNQGIATANGFMSLQAPWSLVKQRDLIPGSYEKASNVVYALLTLLRDMAILMWPVMPESGNKLWIMLGFDHDIHHRCHPGKGLLCEYPTENHPPHQPWIGGALSPGLLLPVPAPLFPKRS